MMKKMKISKKWIWIIAGIFLVSAVGGGVVAAIVVNNNTGEEEVAETKESHDENDEEEKDGEGAEVETEEGNDVNEAKINEQGEKQKVPQYEGDDPNDSENLTGTISYAGVNGEKWMVRVNINQYLTEGQCELNVYQGETVVYNNTANIVGVASTSTCEGFDVPVSRLPKGVLNIKINISAGGKTGVIEGETNI